jgi:cell division protein FtsL
VLKKIRLRTVFAFVLAALSGALLLHTSQSVQKTETEVGELNAEIIREQDSIRMLKTEWAYLNSPARLETLAKQYLNLDPTDPAHIKTDGKQLPSKPLPEDMMQAQPVAYIPVPPAKPHPPTYLKPAAVQPKEKSFDDLINSVAHENIAEGTQ